VDNRLEKIADVIPPGYAAYFERTIDLVAFLSGAGASPRTRRITGWDRRRWAEIYDYFNENTYISEPEMPAPVLAGLRLVRNRPVARVVLAEPPRLNRLVRFAVLEDLEKDRVLVARINSKRLLVRLLNLLRTPVLNEP